MAEIRVAGHFWSFSQWSVIGPKLILNILNRSL